MEKTWTVRPIQTSDVTMIRTMVQETGVFRESEVDVAVELADSASKRKDDYQALVACHNDEVVGYSCFGPTPGTDRTFDLYWMVVSSYSHRKGVGTALLATTEEQIRHLFGRLLVAETSGRPEYEPARNFYKRHGFRYEGRIPYFYADHDDKMFYVKTLRYG